jgi:G3E family GTPase
LAASLVAGIKDFRRNHSPDYLFIEPSELVVTAEMRNVVRMGLRDIIYEVGPYITLINGLDFQALWRERRPLLLGQINLADIVALSQADLLNSEQVAEILDILKPHCDDAILLSSRSGAGIEEMLKTVEGVL